MTTPTEAPLAFASLSPQCVLDLLDAAGLRGDGRVLQLNSYENRVYWVWLEDGRAVVAKFYRPGRWSNEQLLEEHAYALALAAAEVPVVAPLALAPAVPAFDEVGAIRLLGDPPTLAIATCDEAPYRYGVSPARSGRPPELDQPGTLRRIGRFLGRMHAVGAAKLFATRRTLDVETYGDAALDAVRSSGLLPDDAGDRWERTAREALDLTRQRFAMVEYEPLRLHGDCHRGNLLWSHDGPHFVDLDDACNGPAIQDIWMLLDGDAGASRRQLAEIVEGYEEFRDFDRREVALIEALRTLRMIHHSAWIARRWHDPAFPAAFPGFESPSYWSQQAADLRDQIEVMRER